MPHDPPADGIPNAKELAFEVCAHGTVTFELMDGTGKVFARAHLPAETWLDMTAKVLDEQEKLAGPDRGGRMN